MTQAELVSISRAEATRKCPSLCMVLIVDLHFHFNHASGELLEIGARLMYFGCKAGVARILSSS